MCADHPYKLMLAVASHRQTSQLQCANCNQHPTRLNACLTTNDLAPQLAAIDFVLTACGKVHVCCRLSCLWYSQMQ